MKSRKDGIETAVTVSNRGVRVAGSQGEKNTLITSAEEILIKSIRDAQMTLIAMQLEKGGYADVRRTHCLLRLTNDIKKWETLTGLEACGPEPKRMVPL